MFDRKTAADSLLGHIEDFMRNAYIRLIAQAIVQMATMMIFLRVGHLDIFVSAILSALIGIVFGLILYLVQKPKTVGKD